MSTPSLFVFGPQTDWPSTEYLDQLRSKLLSDARLHDIVTAITELHELAFTIADQNPRLKQAPCTDNIRQLQEWLEHGTTFVSSTPPNILSMPMTVIIHLVQYINYLDGSKATHAQILANTQLGGGIQGFCLGLLSAIAVASSKDEHEVVTMGAVALRLAACIGAYIDRGDFMQDAAGGSTSLSLRWKNEIGHGKLLNILLNYPTVSFPVHCYYSACVYI
jgi:Starter unit:ACP transacylase in aflatoxin biosynthesis